MNHLTHPRAAAVAALLMSLAGCELNTYGNDATCDIELQNCPKRMKCMPVWEDDDDDLRLDGLCVPLLDDRNFGEACETYPKPQFADFDPYLPLDDCAAGLYCSQAPSRTSTCVEFCDETMSCASGEGTCVVTEEGIGLCIYPV